MLMSKSKGQFEIINKKKWAWFKTNSLIQAPSAVSILVESQRKLKKLYKRLIIRRSYRSQYPRLDLYSSNPIDR